MTEEQRQPSGAKILISTNDAGTTRYSCTKKKKKNLDPDFILFIKDYRSKFRMQNYKTLKK